MWGANQGLQKYRIVQKIVASTLSLIPEVNLIPGNSVTHLPSTIYLAWSPIEAHPSVDLLFVDEEVISTTKNEQRKNEHISSRVLLADLLKAVGKNPGNMTLKKEPEGKPYLLNGNTRLHLSFTHSREIVMCALSEKLPVGIDCEKGGRDIHQNLLNRILNDDELENLHQEPAIGLWTLKEAAVKCLGTGIRSSLKKVHIHKKSEEKFIITVPDKPIMHGALMETNGHFIAVVWVD
jgi:phosphopantetheinyl transferase